MKIVCAKENLARGVNIVSKAVPVRTTMPILECILIDASTNEIRLLANDMEIAIETVIEGEIIERGIIAIDARFFSEMIRKLPDHDVTMTVNENMTVLFQCEKTEITVPGKDGNEFPLVPEVSRNEPVVMTQFSLKEVIRQTIFSIADNDNNKLMTGELFDIQNNRLKVVSLDGHRISIRNIELKESYGDRKVVVPGKTLNEISKIIPGSAEEMVSLYFTENQIIFEFDETVVVSRLIEGEYFKIDQMLSAEYETKININRRALLESIDRSLLLVQEKDKKPIIMNITDESMEIKINSLIGSMDETIEAKKDGKDILIGFNPKFFIEALRVIDDETVTLYMVNPKAPCYIRDETESYVYLILPVNFTA